MLTDKTVPLPNGAFKATWEELQKQGYTSKLPHSIFRWKYIKCYSNGTMNLADDDPNPPTKGKKIPTDLASALCKLPLEVLVQTLTKENILDLIEEAYI